MTSDRISERSLPLALQVRAVEQRLVERRHRIRRVAARIGPGLRARTISPGMLAAAVGFGVLLHRTADHRTWSLVTLLNAAYTSSSLVTTLSSWVNPGPGTRVDADSQGSQGG